MDHADPDDPKAPGGTSGLPCHPRVERWGLLPLVGALQFAQHRATDHQCPGPMARAKWPEAFGVVAVETDLLETCFGRYVEGVAGGDVLLFRCWYHDPAADLVKLIYHEAGMKRRLAGDAGGGPFQLDCRFHIARGIPALYLRLRVGPPQGPCGPEGRGGVAGRPEQCRSPRSTGADQAAGEGGDACGNRQAGGDAQSQRSPEQASPAEHCGNACRPGRGGRSGHERTA